MKRNFLFMLLLTILPLVGWAQGNLPQGKDLTYNGQPQKLVVQGGTNWQQILYAVVRQTSETAPTRPVWGPNQTFQEAGIIDEVPVATAPGTYYVFWAARQSGDVTRDRWNLVEGECVESGELQNVGVYTVEMKVDLEVKPQTNCIMKYGLPFTLTANDIYLNPAGSTELRTAVVNMLKVNEDLSKVQNVGLQPFTIGLKNPAEKTIIENYVKYVISPTGTGRIDIQQGKNEINERAFQLVEGLVFNGKDQTLVTSIYSFTSYDAEVDGTQWGEGQVSLVSVDRSGAKTVSGIKVLSNSNNADFVGKTFYVYADPTSIPTERVQLYTKESTGLVATGVWVKISGLDWSTYGPVEFYSIERSAYEAIFAGDNAPESEAAYLATVNWKEDLPTGKDAGTYYVWVRAKDGGLLYTGSDPVFVGRGSATIDPIRYYGFSGKITGVADSYYVYTGNDNKNWHGLYRADTTKDLIVPVGSTKEGEQYTKTIGDYTESPIPEAEIDYYVYKITKDNDGNITSSEMLGKFADQRTFGVGRYQIKARPQGNKNYIVMQLNASDVTKEFEVKKPTVVIQTKVNGEPSAAYVHGVAPLASHYSYSIDWTSKGYQGSLNDQTIDKEYRWFAGDDDVTRADGIYPYGTYKVLVMAADEDHPFSAGADFIVEVKPATVAITPSEILAKVENQTLVFGEALPLNLKYSQGAWIDDEEEAPADVAAIKAFEAMTWKSGFVAIPEGGTDADAIKLYADEDHTETTGGGWGVSPVTTQYYKTTILPVGKYTVKAKVKFGDNNDNQILVAAGEWTITPKDINNEDFGDFRYDTPDPRVKGLNSLSLHKTYTSNEIELTQEDFGGKFTYRQGLVAIPLEQGAEPTAEQIALINKQIGFYYGGLTLGKDFEITEYTDNVKAGTATFHVKGINNFKGEKDLTFTIDKGKIYVFPFIPKNGNVWAVGTKEVKADGSSIYEVDWEGKELVTVDGVTVPRGVKYQLHAFEQDRPLTNPDIVKADGFKALSVKRIQGANVGEYKEGLKAYAIDGEEAENYEFVFQKAPLSIIQGTIKLAVAEATATYSGTDRPRVQDAAGDFVLAPNQNLDPALEQNWQMVANKEKAAGITWTDNLNDYRIAQNTDPETYQYPASAALGEGKAYTITCTAFPEGTYSSSNYKFELETNTGALTVNPAKATITVVGNVENAEVPTISKSYKDFTDAAWGWNATHPNDLRTAEYYKNKFISQIGSLEKDNKGNVTGIKYVSVTGEQPGDNKYTNLYKSTTVKNEKDIIVSAQDNKNYEFTLVNGILDITPVPVSALLALKSEPVKFYTDQYGDYTDAEGHDLPAGADPIVSNPWGSANPADLLALQANDNVPYEAVTIDLKAAALTPANEAYSQWKAGEWHTMVLPFATTVGDIAYNFGYAIVNVVDVEATNASTKPNEVHFKLQEIMEEIPANTPFCIKSQFDFDYDKTLKFGNVEGALNMTGEPILIEYKAKPSEPAGKTFTFEGTYDQLIIDKNTPTYRFLGPNNRWKQFSETSTSKYTLQPYSGYVNLQGFTGTREVTFFFEEEDGSTTAINAAELQKKSTEGLYNVQGMKVQNANQKGIYIQNNKKFIVK